MSNPILAQMTTADKLTSSRLVIAPIFFVLYFIDIAFAIDKRIIVPLLWILFIAMELSDLFDGQAARRSGSVSDFGKLFDPFADVLARITYFLCFAFTGLMPLWVLLVILYREYGILFMRMLVARKGVAMGASSGGKVKAVTYMVAGSLSMVQLTLNVYDLFPEALNVVTIVSIVVYCAAAVLSVTTFVDYYLRFRSVARV